MGAPGPLTLGEFIITALAYQGEGPAPATNPPLVDRLYAALPAAYRRTDPDRVLARFLEATTVAAGAMELLADAIDYVPPDEGGPAVDTSLLVDPANTAWPEWLAWLVGVDLAAAGIRPGFTGDPEARELIAAGVNGHKAGSNAAIAAAARRTLDGTRTVIVRPGVDEDPHVITVSTAAAETPDPDALAAAVLAVLPAGHGLALDNNVGNWQGVEDLGAWDDIETGAATWADLEALFG